jgi:two-component system chemotaxis response regulator CheB
MCTRGEKPLIIFEFKLFDCAPSLVYSFTKTRVITNTSTFLVVIGTSAGGFQALDALIPQFDVETNAAYCIVVHLSNIDIRPFLVNRLQPTTQLPCIAAEDGLAIKTGHIYVAQPGAHLLVKDGKFLSGYGTDENNFKPSIDVLFRSAAVEYNSHTIGIILTGLLHDGTAGMEAIKLCGGTLIVQDPLEAQYASMPLSVLRNMKVDYCSNVDSIGKILKSVIDNKVVSNVVIPAAIRADVKRAGQMLAGIEGMDEIGEKSGYGCPDCGGPLWKIKGEGNTQRYHCHIGHSYLEEDLISRQGKMAESSIWAAIRIMEERKHLLVKRAAEMGTSYPRLASDYDVKIMDLQEHIATLKALAVAVQQGA